MTEVIWIFLYLCISSPLRKILIYKKHGDNQDSTIWIAPEHLGEPKLNAINLKKPVYNGPSCGHTALQINHTAWNIYMVNMKGGPEQLRGRTKRSGTVGKLVWPVPNEGKMHHCLCCSFMRQPSLTKRQQVDCTDMTLAAI